MVKARTLFGGSVGILCAWTFPPVKGLIATAIIILAVHGIEFITEREQ